MSATATATQATAKSGEVAHPDDNRGQSIFKQEEEGRGSDWEKKGGRGALKPRREQSKSLWE
jgi:hypothetical protein